MRPWRMGVQKVEVRQRGEEEQYALPKGLDQGGGVVVVMLLWMDDVDWVELGGNAGVVMAHLLIIMKL